MVTPMGCVKLSRTKQQVHHNHHGMQKNRPFLGTLDEKTYLCTHSDNFQTLT